MLKLPLSQKSGQFTVAEGGDYAIWQAKKTWKRVPVNVSLPAIFDLQTGKKIMVHPSFSNVRVNNGSEGRIQLAKFWAQPGQYGLESAENSAASESLSAYFLEIREARSAFLLVFLVLVLILAGNCLILGIVSLFHVDVLTSLLE